MIAFAPIWGRWCARAARLSDRRPANIFSTKATLDPREVVSLAYKRPRASQGSGYPGLGGYSGVSSPGYPPKIPGGDCTFPSGGSFGAAQNKSTQYDSGGIPTGTRFYPRLTPETSLPMGRPPRGVV